MLNPEQLCASDTRLLRIIGRMPLVSAQDLVPILNNKQEEIQEKLVLLHKSGWVTSTRRGMLNSERNLWLLSQCAVKELYSTDHLHPAPEDMAEAGGIRRLRAGLPPLAPGNEKFAFDHEHRPHLEDRVFSPFTEPAAGLPATPDVASDWHEHPPWTATARGQQTCLRRLAALEAIYRIAPELFTSGRLLLPQNRSNTQADQKMTDFRLLRRGTFFHAVARYGEDIWTTFTFLGLHVTERIARRKQAHRYWGLDCYVAADDQYLRLVDRFFYEDPQYPVEPSAQVIVAADEWAAEIAQRILIKTAPTLICTPKGHSTAPVAARPSFDYISDPEQHPKVGQKALTRRWVNKNLDLEAVNRPTGFQLFTAIAEFPGMRASWLCEITGLSSRTVSRTLFDFIERGVAVKYEDCFFLAKAGMKRAADLSRVRFESIYGRHAAYFDTRFRLHQLRHDDGVNQLVLKFAREGVKAIGGWRGELNLPNVTQIKPDLIVLVDQGPYGSGPHCIEYERKAAAPVEAVRKLSTYRKSAAVGVVVPLLVVCESERAVSNFLQSGQLASPPRHSLGCRSRRSPFRRKHHLAPGRRADPHWGGPARNSHQASVPGVSWVN